MMVGVNRTLGPGCDGAYTDTNDGQAKRQMETRTENVPISPKRTQFSLRSVIICFTSIGVILGLFKVSQLKVTDGLIICGATICLLFFALPLILRQMKAFPLERFRDEWSIVSFVSLGGAIYGFCFGGIVGAEAAMGGRLVDTIFLYSCTDLHLAHLE